MTSSASRAHRPIESGREIVENDNTLATLHQLQHHVPADEAGAAGHQDTHTLNPASTVSIGPLSEKVRDRQG